MVSSAGTAKESVSMAKQRSRARGAAMYLYVFGVVLELRVVLEDINEECGHVRQVLVEAPLIWLQRSKR